MIIDKKKIRVVCSLTTIPDILKNNKKEFEKMLDTLINIFDDVYLGIPKISNIEWHPFSIASSPGDTKQISFMIRSVGDWTSKLYRN